MGFKRLGTILKRYRTKGEENYRSWDPDHMTCAQLAKELGVSKPTLTRIERGEKIGGDTLTNILWWIFEKDVPKAKSNGKVKAKKKAKARR